MAYGEDPLRGRAKQLFEAHGMGVWVIGLVLSTAYIGSEWNRIRTLPPQTMNYLYFALLVATLVLVGGWIVFTKEDLEVLSDWLDPDHYQPPNEKVLIIWIGLILAALLLTARNPIWFGAAYVLLSVSNVAASTHMRREFLLALKGSRKRLDGDRSRPELAASVAVHEKALEALERFMVVRPNLKRLAVVVAVASVGLGLSIYGEAAHRSTAEAAAYVLYLLNIAGPDGAVIAIWRWSLQGDLRPLTAERYELLRASGRLRGASG